MDLFILRHAIAQPRTPANRKADAERRLTSEGEKKMCRIAKGMQAAGLDFDLSVISRAAERGELHQPLDWKLYSLDHHRIPLNSEDSLRDYLKGHPDEDFWLVPGPFMNREIR